MARMTEKASALDSYIGNRIREQRENVGMTQGELAQAAGVSYQQIHKYEYGANRISAGRLGHIAMIFNIPVQHFYDGYNTSYADGVSVNTEDGRLCLEMARHFRQIGNARYQEALHQLVRTLADSTISEAPVSL